MSKYLGVFTRHDYQESGATKSKWYKVGYMKMTENGGHFLRFFHQPQTAFYCFEPEEELKEIQIED